MGKKHYGIADRAWQPVVGCSPSMPCAPRCWARRTVARVVECQRGTSPERAEFFQIALTLDGKRWSGEVVLDEKHLLDPLRWKKPAVVATGFHGDWARLRDVDKDSLFAVMAQCPQHDFMPLTKRPDAALSWLRKMLWNVEGFSEESAERSLPNVSIGCSVMNQSEADKMLPAMKALSQMGWRTHVWHEPALGPVDWTGWEFIELLITGGESGPDARPCDVAWIRSNVDWCAKSWVRWFVKQLGARPIDSTDFSFARQDIQDRKGADPAEWPVDLQVQQYPEVSRGTRLRAASKEWR